MSNESPLIIHLLNSEQKVQECDATEDEQS
jgi:hypothetical protein